MEIRDVSSRRAGSLPGRHTISADLGQRPARDGEKPPEISCKCTRRGETPPRTGPLFVPVRTLERVLQRHRSKGGLMNGKWSKLHGLAAFVTSARLFRDAGTSRA